MMKHLIVILAIITSTSVFSKSSGMKRDRDRDSVLDLNLDRDAIIMDTFDECYPFVEDKFHHRVKMLSGGEFPGECYLTETYRNIVILNDEELIARGITKKEDHIYFANFNHDGTFYIAEYEKGSIENIIIQFEKFFESPLLKIATGHTQTRFQLKEGKSITLYSQTGSEAHGTISIKDFIFSFNAIRTESLKDEGFDPINAGLNNGYGSSWNFYSTKEQVRRFEGKTVEVEQTLLNFTNNEKEIVFMTYLNKSNGHNYNDYYNTLGNSCITGTMLGYDTARSRQFKLWGLKFWRNFNDMWRKQENNPNAVYDYLRKQKLFKNNGPFDRGESVLPNFEEEFSF